MIRALSSIARTAALYRQSLFRPPALALQPCLEGIASNDSSSSSRDPAAAVGSSIGDIIGSLWFAVPKKRVSKSKKRMKTTWQYKIKKKENIILDPKTGEMTLMHHLPKNWKKYVPDPDLFVSSEKED
uniref:Uncharacterized protein n=1 Tax=Odontella aurita TaxID=265563 RepID=A0A7S4IBP8_9STRA|mmetsp:Transcript_22732/g.67194  ORF Transcript_22732/g.67194 Transcript_22732/m.67194 type:complete len:128 (-) Transcript_22732:298-681(-)|eukprot:CAMPEP_0113531256 /NCGR_PEP_ID=MMETSP0015_2-20120614/3397_1 /TAXON_ID=2838 /ORGANISM="Odontella" /LENGTH=127 /DNA_ID=CAMNT_0000430075 /DNA_START=317 /DNA_END=700 /DNA_ORIENTATION=+ /assembly_acc=CAM_ASM_000160